MLERIDEGAQLPLGRRLVEPSDPDVDRMDLASADEGHDLVAGLLQPQAALDDRGRIAGELHGSVVTEEVGRVEHVDVERVALDPLAAVEEPAQHLQRLRDLDSADCLHRVQRAHLVRDRADAADPRGDVRRLEERPAAKHGLEEPRRLEDPKLHVLHRPVREPHRHRALALDPGR